MRYLVVMIVAAVILSGCSGMQRQGDPAPVISRDGSTAPRQEGSVVITPLQAPSGTSAKPAPNRAVQLLHERAQAQVNAGDFTAAAKTLERALSIQPKNARSWNLLAHLRAKQKKYSMAAEIAAKSNSMAAVSERSLKKDNLLLIAQMKTLLGDKVGANRARQQASSLN